MLMLERILLVTEDASLQEKFRGLFNAEQCQYCFHYAEAARLLNAGYTPDLIIVDLILPVITGAETLDLLQKQLAPKEVPGIIVTQNDRLVLHSLPRPPALLGIISKKADPLILFERIKKLWEEYQVPLIDGEIIPAEI